MGKENCPQCKDLPEGKVVMGHDHRKKPEKSRRQKSYEFLVDEFKDNGFTEQQAVYIINLLDDLIPLV